MIKAIFQRDETGNISSFDLSGHADAGEYGSDIVCAAVSALAISATNGIDALAGVTPTLKTDERAGGYLAVELPLYITQEQNNISQVLLENLLLGLQAIQAEHTENISIQTLKK